LQLAAGERSVCVDTLRCGSLDPLVPALNAPRAPSHPLRASGSRAFYLNVKRVISPIFDTQIAAGGIGLKPQIGYAGSGETLLDVSLPRADAHGLVAPSAHRAQLEYAATTLPTLNEIADR